MKKVLYLLSIAIVAIFGMCACGKDKTEDPQPKQDEIFIVKGVAITSEWDGQQFTFAYKFSYKNEKLFIVNYSMEGTETYTDTEEISDLYLAKHKFSEDNYVVRCDYPIEEEYDKEGYNTYTWSKGNLTEIKQKYQNQNYSHYDNESEIKYSDIENKTNIDWAMFLYMHNNENYNSPYYFSKDYLLNISKNIPNYFVGSYIKNVEIDEQGRLVTFTQDDQGLISKYTVEY